jgi:hypothetical protein
MNIETHAARCCGADRGARSTTTTLSITLWFALRRPHDDNIIDPLAEASNIISTSVVPWVGAAAAPTLHDLEANTDDEDHYSDRRLPDPPFYDSAESVPPTHRTYGVLFRVIVDSRDHWTRMFPFQIE